MGLKPATYIYERTKYLIFAVINMMSRLGYILPASWCVFVWHFMNVLSNFDWILHAKYTADLIKSTTKTCGISF